MTKEIILSNGKKVLVDDQDYEWLSKYKWRCKKDNRTYYACCNVRKEDGSWTTELMHRMIMGCNRGDGKQVDHINGHGWDNRRDNLRILPTKEQWSEQQLNARIPVTNTSGYRGVYHAYKGKYHYWRAWVQKTDPVDGIKKPVYQRHFPYTPQGKIQAAEHVDMALLFYFPDGEDFAKLNFPKKVDWYKKRIAEGVLEEHKCK